MLTVVPAVLGYPDAVRGHSAKNIVTIYTESEPRKFHWERMTYKQNKNTYHFLDSSVFAHFYSTRNHRSTSRGTMFCARVNEANVPTTAKKTRFWMTHQTAHGLTEQRHRGKKKDNVHGFSGLNNGNITPESYYHFNLFVLSCGQRTISCHAFYVLDLPLADFWYHFIFQYTITFCLNQRVHSNPRTDVGQVS